MKLVHICLSILIVAGVVGCKKKPTETNQPAQTTQADSSKRVATPAQNDAETAKNNIATVLTKYYGDLEKEAINENDYFAPTLIQFFKKTNFSREDVGKAIRTGFNSVENRKIVFDANNLQITPTADGYVADFEVNASYTRSSDKKAMNEKLKNRVMFDKEFKIVSYTNAEETGSEGTPENFAKAVAYSIASENALASLVHPQKGITLVFRNGAIDNVKHYASYADLLKENAALKNVFSKADINVVTHKVPKNMNCEDVEKLPKGEGWFDTAENFQGISTMMRELSKEKATERSFSSRTVSAERQQEALVTHQLLCTDLRTIFYMGQVDGKWYILAIDRSRLTCEI